MLRLTGTERAVADVAAVAEHVASLTAAAATFQRRPDLPSAPEDGAGSAVVRLLDEQTAGDAAGTLAEISKWAMTLSAWTTRLRCGERWLINRRCSTRPPIRSARSISRNETGGKEPKPLLAHHDV